ncbi:hypothetical protein AZKH_2242 [Azoarcus sp. KH32C]|nr:hypothetical protein AZKH_2242 [Azoarcus sp. KH32C]
MPLIDAANTADALQQIGIARNAPKGIRRIRGKGDEPTRSHDLRGLADQARLGVLRVQGKILRHAKCPILCFF